VRALLRGHQPGSRRRWRKATGRTPATVPKLRAVRQALGVGFKEFARLAGISESHLANLEEGKRRVSRKMQRRLVSAVARLRAERPERWEQVTEIAG
jgi:transcriptional regulator with XRE-family HTH domain